MFGLFKKKSQLDQLNDQYQALLKESHTLSTVDRKASDEKIAEAEKILLKIQELQKG